MPKETPKCGVFLYLYWCPPLRPVRFYSLPSFVFFFFPKEEEEFPFRTKAFGKEIPSSCATSRVESFLCMYFSWHNEHIQTTGMHTAAFAGPYGSREQGVLSVAQVVVAWRGLWSSVLSINASILLCYTNVLEDATTGGNEQREKF